MGGLEQAVSNRAAVAEIKRLYDTGVISREQAKTLAQPVIELINGVTVSKTAELNKKYGLKRRPALVDFVNLMR